MTYRLEAQVSKEHFMFPPFLLLLAWRGLVVRLLECLWLFPKRVANEVVFADVVGEEVDTGRVLLMGRGNVVELQATEHGAFTHDAGRNFDGIDGLVELGMR